MQKIKCTMEGCTHKTMQLASRFRPLGENGVKACMACCYRLGKGAKPASRNDADKENESPGPPAASGAASSFLSQLITYSPSSGEVPFFLE